LTKKRLSQKEVAVFKQIAGERKCSRCKLWTKDYEVTINGEVICNLCGRTLIPQKILLEIVKAAEAHSKFADYYKELIKELKKDEPNNIGQKPTP